MTNRFQTPNPQFVDGAALPYAGGTLTFYATGTSTPLSTYADAALTIANTNPIVLDSAGRTGSVFLQNLAYKVVLADVNGVQIWTLDPVYTSDFSAIAQFASISGSPNGRVAGTAGSVGVPASAYWDFTNNILYVCTQTGNSSTAVWTAVNASTAAAVVPPPQGYLTPVSGVAVITGDVAGASSILYTPYNGNLVPIYNGASFTPTNFSELNLSLTSSQSASTIYDVFVFNNSGVPTLVTGPAWASSTGGTSSRGTGAGTTQLARVLGIWVNAVSITGRNGATTYAIPANQATYLGSILIDTSAGQVSCYRTWGLTRGWGIWNAYNRQAIILQGGDSTATWAYALATVRPANNNTANSISVLCGLQEEEIYIRRQQLTDRTKYQLIGIGLNSTTSYYTDVTYSQGAVLQTVSAVLLPTLGFNKITQLENVSDTSNSNYSGTKNLMTMEITYRG